MHSPRYKLTRPLAGLFCLSSLLFAPLPVSTATPKSGRAVSGLFRQPTITRSSEKQPLQPAGTVFSNSSPIVINNNSTATPYPSTILVSGLNVVQTLSVTLSGITHGRPDDLDVVLFGPTGVGVLLTADNGGVNAGDALVNVTVTFDPNATNALPDGGPITSGVYRPTNNGGATFPAPCAGSFTTNLGDFSGTSPNGTWNLCIVDDSSSGVAGSIATGWSLDIVSSTTQTFTSAGTNAPILINDGGSSGTTASASPYPSTIAVSGVPANFGKVVVTFTNVDHVRVDDIEAVLVGPGGQNVMLMSDAGGNNTVNNVTLDFDDNSQNSLPDNGPLVSGRFKPTNEESTADVLPSPAPSSPFGTMLTTFRSSDPNGTWSLYVADNSGSTAGQNTTNSRIDGWSLTFFTPTAADALVTGTITDADGAPLEGVVVNLNGTENRKFITDANGIYRFENVESNGFYTVTPSRSNYSFSPAERSFSQLGNVTEAAFTGNLVGDTENPLDTPEYFVRQHYLDFLGREPDESGFNFWSDAILACGDVADCIEPRRVGVSTAYLLSIEFGQTGGLVDGLYRASYARRPLFAEFIPDTAALGQNVVVGRGGWQLQLETNKKSFLDNWVQRADFRNAYDSLSNDSYVDHLIANTGVAFSSSERDELVSGLVSGALTRANVLQRIAENENFVNAKRNEFFVMMEYFGYLRRDPDEAGFQFWLGKLNQFDGNIERAEMVNAFITSIEYRSRFRR